MQIGIPTIVKSTLCMQVFLPGAAISSTFQPQVLFLFQHLLFHSICAIKIFKRQVVQSSGISLLIKTGPFSVVLSSDCGQPGAAGKTAKALPPVPYPPPPATGIQRQQAYGGSI